MVVVVVVVDVLLIFGPLVGSVKGFSGTWNEIFCLSKHFISLHIDDPLSRIKSVLGTCI